MPSHSSALKYKGAGFFRQRLILSTLSGRPLKISQIRSYDDDPGLSSSEVNLLKLFDLVCNGASTVISDTGSTVLYRPGAIIGGAGLEFDCGTERGISYYAEALLCLAPFAKKPLGIVLNGVTNGRKGDLSVDTLRTVVLPVLRNFGIGEETDFHLKITKRGAFPKGGGTNQDSLS